MTDLLQAFLAVLQSSPLGVWAFLASMVISWGVMLRIRTWSSSSLSVHARQFVGHFGGFASSVAASWAVWPNRWGLVVGVVTALFGPWSWEVALLLLELRWPAIAAKLRQAPSP